jgi:hypothetical protein
MKRLAEYLERVHVFERMAARETDPKLKVQLAKQAAAYRKLAVERAARLQLSRHLMCGSVPGLTTTSK